MIGVEGVKQGRLRKERGKKVKTRRKGSLHDKGKFFKACVSQRCIRVLPPTAEGISSRRYIRLLADNL